MRPEAAPNDRFCDIVMEGGVTSGIIYASAVAELAKYYRFSSIGGSSIGAFAAALTAAAEYSRRRGSSAGFGCWSNCPPNWQGRQRRSNASAGHVQAAEGKRRLFEIFLATLDRGSGSSRFAHGLAEAFRQYWRDVLIAWIATAVFVLSGPLLLTWLSWNAPAPDGFGLRLIGLGSWILAFLIALVSATVVTLVVRIAWDFRCGVVPNGFGLCRGWSEEEDMNSPDLAGFLHISIQTAAGRHPIDGEPLTFADLRDAPGPAGDVLGQPRTGDSRPSIDLQVYSTNLAHGRPYRFPSDPADDMGRLFFRVDDLKPYFPKPVLKHLIGFAVPYRPLTCSDPEVSEETKQFLELPTGRLPIVVAARLAMSFPLLISAVPLWAIDYEAPKERRGFARCWMSDGGLCSNFPIHLFDSFVPEWPTFGVSLQTRSTLWPYRRVWLPDKHYQGRGDTWDRFAETKQPLGRLAGFLVSLWLSAWRWNDTTMMRMPGVRDRVVRIFLEEGEGGVNIKMSQRAIDNLSLKYGKPAAEAFRKSSPTTAVPAGTSIAGCASTDCDRAAATDRRLQVCDQRGSLHATLGDQIEDARATPPLRGPRRKWSCPLHSQKPPSSEIPLITEQADELKALLAGLSELEERFRSAGNHEPYVCVPRPSLRVRHPT
jgi:predicted acylesterase/phospholipase RssA